MVKQQNLEKIAQFFKEFLRILRKIIFSFGGCIRLSFHIKFFQNRTEIVRFITKIFLISSALVGFVPPPEPPHTPSNELLDCVLGPTSEFYGKKLKFKRKISGKITKIRQRSGGPPPEPPGRIEFSINIIFLSKSVQKIHEIYEVINF